LSPTASSGLPVTLVVTSGPATISGGNVVAVTGVGTVVITASQPGGTLGGTTYSAATSVAQSFAVTACVVPPTAQTITFAAIPAHTACDASFTLSPTASSGLPVTLVVTSGPATISGGNVVAVTGTGTVVITASQPGGTLGGTTYSAATSVAQSFAVTACVVPPTAQTITFAAIPAHTACDASFTLSPTASSGLPVTLVVTSGPATISGGNVVAVTGVGTVVITASQPGGTLGGTTYSAATSVAQSFAVTACVVTPIAQTITFVPIPNHTACDTSFTVNPTASSGLPVTLTVTSGPAIISGNIVTLTGAGSVTLQATQAGNGTFSSAAPVSQTFAVTGAPTITNVPLTAAGTFGTPFSFAISASGTTTGFTAFNLPPGLFLNPVTGVISGTPTRDNNTTFVTLTATNGTCGSPPVYLIITIGTGSTTVVPPIPQTITFDPIPGHTACDSSFMVNPTASSGLPVTLAVTSGPAIISGNTVIITGPGSVTLQATQAGNGTYASATPVSQTFVVTSAPIITNNPLTAAGVVGTPFSFTLTASGSPTGFTAFNLPAGLFLNPVTGVISGTPSTADLPTPVVVHATATAISTEPSPRRSLNLGPTFVTITATNGTCVSPAVYLIITIVANSAPVATPIITNSPLTASGTLGTPFSFAITASGSPTGFTAFNLPPGLFLSPLTGVISGTPTRDNNTTFVTLTATNAIGTSPGTYLVIKIGSGTAISGQPVNTTAVLGGSAAFSVGSNGGAAVTYQWRKDGVDLPGATSATLSIDNVQPANVGLYTVVSSSNGGTATTLPALLEMSFPGQTAGGAIVVAAAVQHPNGNIYDQVLLTGPSASVKATAGESVRVSYIDLTDDIVQVEFAGAGVLTINLDNASGPATAVKYDQPTVAYMKGHASIAITGANATTNLSVFSVGRLTATNQALFRAGTAYDGWADIELVTVVSTDGHFGGVRTANANYFRTQGMTGLYAPGVQFGGPVYVGDIDAAGSANAVLMLGSVADARITGGDLFQDNGGNIEVSGMTRLQFTAGTSSGGTPIPAQTNRSRFMTNGVEVTSQLVAP
jgi:hypothetical protein